MQLNEIHNPQEHASVSLKVILLVFAVILVGVLGYLVWDYNNTPDNTDYSSTTIKKTDSSSTEEADETADWKTYTNEERGYTFKYPSTYSIKKYSVNYIQVYKTGGNDTLGPTFKYAEYGETLAADSNDPPKQTIKISNFDKLKEYMNAIGYKDIASTTINGQSAIFIDEESPEEKGRYFGYLVDSDNGYYSLSNHQDVVVDIEKTILLTFKLVN